MSKAINTLIIKVKSGVRNVSSITGTIFLTCFSRYATIIPINNEASSPPIPGVKGLPVKGSITVLLSSTFKSKGSTGFATNIEPIIPPSTAVPPNSLAAFIPTYMARYPNITKPTLFMAANHHTVLYAFFVITFITFVSPIISPAAIIPGSSGTNIFAIF